MSFVQKLDVMQLMQEAKTTTTEIKKFAGDWRTQIDLLNKAVEVVTEYQKAIHRAFAIPFGQVGPNGFTFRLPEGVVAKEEFDKIEELNFKGAALVQTIDVQHHAESHASGTTVVYKAILKVDENHFLKEMLPRVQNLRNADPDYTIYDLSIEIPKGELIAESLRMLNDKLNEPEKREPDGPNWTVARPFAGTFSPLNPTPFAPMPGQLAVSTLFGTSNSDFISWKRPGR